MTVIRIATGIALCHAIAFAQTDDDIRAKIEQVAKLANAVVIDGQAQDWAGIPKLTDSPVDGSSGARRDIVAVSIAPRADDLLILIETEEPPPPTPHEFLVNIDLLGDPAYDFLLAIGENGTSTIAIYDGNDPNEYQDAPKVEAVFGDAVEARLPYTSLRALLPLDMRRQFAGANARTWMRAIPLAWDSAQKRYADSGPAIASFTLAPMPHLDAPLPRDVKSPAVIPPPFRGRWFITQGAFGNFTHENEWSYDFEMLDEQLDAAPGGASPNNEDYHAWDQPIIAPVTAGVIRIKDGAEDGAPHQDPDPSTPVNGTYLKLNDESTLWLGHMREGSVRVRSGEVVARGAELGRVGNSGYSNEPHLHITAYQLPAGTHSKPIALANVTVSLNPIPDDPWARRLVQWHPREGYFVEGR
ncbi:MAG: hypothetical protein DHS20C16_36720 [Phycisphaerae bacterium]|nr:MAG: hypothetical protein DHS20C16_36720 [Phycisphaerae bacterium]